MSLFWIDADVFIQAHNGLYAIDLAPPFWKFIDEQAKNRTIRSSLRVYKEILASEDNDDVLAKWVKNRKNSGLFVDPSSDKSVQEKVTEINDWVYKQYAQKYGNYAKVREFLSGADTWTISHAACCSAIVVSHESRVDRTSQKPKIPNVCTRFGVECIDLKEMLRRLRFTFQLK